MTHIRRFACNRLYVGKKYLSQAVVEINDKGQVEGYMPLIQETPATEWIGGVIVLWNKEELPLLKDLKSLLQSLPDGEDATYARHITHVDFQQETLTPESIIRRL